MSEPKDQKAEKPGRAALMSFVVESDLNLSMIDRDGVMVAASKGLVSSFGVSYEDFVGRHLSEVLPAEELGFLKDLSAGRVPKLVNAPRQVDMADGQVQWLISQNSPWYDQDGSLGGIISLTQNITAEQHAQVELGRAEALFEAVFDSIPAMVFVEDFPQRQRQRMNRVSREFLGLPEVPDHVDWTDTNISETVSDSHNSAMAASEATGEIVASEEEVLDSNGVAHTVYIRRRVITDRSGARHALTVSEDVTERKAAEVKLEAALAEAEAANRAKSEFLANMSHEIRTPLNGVMGIASALARTELTSAQTEMVSLIETSAKTLEALLSDILDLARIESGKMEIKAESFDLGHSVKACGALFAASAEAKGLDYRVEVDPGAAGGYLGDAPRIRQIISNMLGNAVKFTTSGGVSLKVSAVRGETASRLRFDVSDTGIGFDAEAKAKLFSRFQQADGSITRKFGGTGLGLAISRSLAEAMGGGLSADSEPGRGSTFTLELELPRSIGETEIWDGVEEVEPEAPELGGFSVLVAEDHPTNRKVVELILGSLDLELTCVEDGAQAVAAVEQRAFDLILMDMQMPVMDGLTAIRIIREMEAREVRPRTPIFSLTANALREHIDASKAAGADGHLTKPITADALIAKVMAVANGELGDDEDGLQAAVG